MCIQLEQLFPLCEDSLRVREFVRAHSRYEYGLVSHALAAAMKASQSVNQAVAGVRWPVGSKRRSMARVMRLYFLLFGSGFECVLACVVDVACVLLS